MRWLCVVFAVTLAACGDGGGGATDAGADATTDAAIDAGPDAGADPYRAFFDGVDGPRLIQTLRELAGEVPVTVGGTSFSIGERWTDAGRAEFRTYWRAVMEGMGLTVRQLNYHDPSTARAGVDLEAVLPGASPDSIIIIVHYDSIGPPGAEASNPGVDDDMSGMAIQIETARLLSAARGRLARTVRLVVTDQEEVGGLAGARHYASVIRAEATAAGFALVAGVDDEQSGWNCQTDPACPMQRPTAVFDVFACDGAGVDYPALSAAVTATAARYGAMKPEAHCMGANSDHYALWEIGVPAIVISEHDPFDNPHFDQGGDDSFARIDQAYLIAIARPSIAFQAELVGVAP